MSDTLTTEKIKTDNILTTVESKASKVTPFEGFREVISGSKAVLEALIAEGVDTIFGYPGGAIMPIYDALYDYHEQLKHILVRHEQGGIHGHYGGGSGYSGYLCH